jgi:hypothetical protein
LPDAPADARRPRRLRLANGASPSVHGPRRAQQSACRRLPRPTPTTLEARATYTKPPSSDGIECLVLTAIDFRSGRTVFRRRAGTGVGFNNNYAPVTLGADGSACVGLISVLVRFSDTGPPPGG